MGDLPLRTPRHRRLGGPLPRQLANVPHAHPSPINLSSPGDASRRVYAVLDEISLDYPPVTGRLHTCYSPVRRSPADDCSPPLPLDLHVLSLSLAFILSQDQTLRCCILFFFFSYSKIPIRFFPTACLRSVYCASCGTRRRREFPLALSCTTFYCNHVNVLCCPGISPKASAKLHPFPFPTKFFHNYFSYKIR